MGLLTSIVPIQNPAWYQGPDIAPNASCIVCATGSGFLGVNTAPPSGRPCNAGGAVPPFGFAGDAAAFGYYAATGGASVVATGPYGIVIDAMTQGAGPPSTWSVGAPPTFNGTWDSSTAPIGTGFAPGNGTPYLYTNNTGVTKTLWSVFNGLGGTFYWSDYSGGPFTITYNDVITTPTLTLSSLSTTAVTLLWNATTGAQSYNIYRNGIIIGTTTALSFTDMAVIPGMTYAYMVQGIAPCQTSNLSNTITLTIPDPQNTFGWVETCAGDPAPWVETCAGDDNINWTITPITPDLWTKN